MKYKTVLLIDDDPEDIEIFMEAVRKVDKEIIFTSSTDAVSVLEQLRTGFLSPDLIFLDFHMPILNGNLFLERMQESNLLKNKPIILYSTHSIEVMRSLTKSVAPFSYISKPSSLRELVTILETVLKN